MDKQFLMTDKDKKSRFTKHVVSILLILYMVLNYIVLQIIGEASRIGGVLLISPIFFLLIFSIMINGFKVFLSCYDYLVHIVLLAGYCLLSSLWAVDWHLSFSKGIDILETAAIMYIITQSIYYTLDIDDLLKVLMYTGYVVVLFQIPYYGMQHITDALYLGVRVDDELINSNVLGMCAAYAVLINIYFLIKKNANKLSITAIVLSAIVVAATGSRKALVVLFGGVFVFFTFCSLGYHGLKGISRRLAIIIALLVGFFAVVNSRLFSVTVERMNGALGLINGKDLDKSSMIRLALHELGISLFLKKPLLGIGIDNSRLFTFSKVGKAFYLHNNYLELLACGGIVGFSLFYWIVLNQIVKMMKNRRFYEIQYCICLTLLVLSILLDYGMVSYYSKDRFFCIMIISVYCREKLKKNL